MNQNRAISRRFELPEWKVARYELQVGGVVP